MFKPLLLFLLLSNAQTSLADKTEKKTASKQIDFSMVDKLKSEIVELEELLEVFKLQKDDETKGQIKKKIEKIELHTKRMKNKLKLSNNHIGGKIQKDVIRLKKNLGPYLDKMSKEASTSVKDGIGRLGKALKSFKGRMRKKIEKAKKPEDIQIQLKKT